MKICFIADDFYPNLGGISHTLTKFFYFFNETKHSMTVLNPNISGNNLINLLDIRNYGFKAISLFLRKKKYISIIFRLIYSLLKDKKTPFSHRIKIIIYLFYKPNILIRVIKNIYQIYPKLKHNEYEIIGCGGCGWILLLGFILSRMLNLKLFAFAHGNDFLVKSPLTLKTYYLRNTDLLIVSNKVIKNLIVKMHHLNEESVVFIEPTLDVKELEVSLTKSELRNKYGFNYDQFILISVGKHVKRKRFDLVIEVISEILKINPKIQIKYNLIGNGPETGKLESLVRKLNLEQYITIINDCDEQKKQEFYALSDIFIMPVETSKTDIEGFGVVYLEANFYKLPAIGTSTGGVKEAIIDNQTGFLLKENSISTLIDKIMFLYHHREKLVKMGINGYERVIKYFSWETKINDYVKALEKIFIQ